MYFLRIRFCEDALGHSYASDSSWFVRRRAITKQQHWVLTMNLALLHSKLHGEVLFWWLFLHSVLLSWPFALCSAHQPRVSCAEGASTSADASSQLSDAHSKPIALALPSVCVTCPPVPLFAHDRCAAVIKCSGVLLKETKQVIKGKKCARNPFHSECRQAAPAAGWCVSWEDPGRAVLRALGPRVCRLL